MSDGQWVVRCFQRILDTLVEHEQELARLDSVAGDGDHGAGMVRGFRAVVAQVDAEDNLPDALLHAGRHFSVAAGGSSGALYSMLLMTLGSMLKNKTLDTSAMHLALDAGAKAIARLGKAKVGDKTMLDSLVPFVETFGKYVNTRTIPEAWALALPDAEAGMNATVDMVSKRGRSAALGEKSRGTRDAGATSMYYILQAVGEVLGESKQN